MSFYALILAALALPVGFHEKPPISIQEQAKANYAQEQKFQWIQKSLSTIPFIAGSAAAKSLVKSENRFLSSLGGILGSIFSDYMLSTSLSKQVMTAINLGSKQATSLITGSVVEEDRHPTDALFIEIERLGLEFEQNKDKLTTDTQALFKKLLKSAQTAKHHGRIVASMTGDDQANIETIKKQFTPITAIMRFLLELPQQTQVVDLDNNLRTKLLPILDRYSNDLQKDIKIFTTAISRSSKLPESSKSVLYLIGKPGTGKTTFTKSFAAAIGLPLISIMDIEKALESKAPLFGFSDTINESFKLSLFTEMLKNQPKNAILFLDELDKVLNKPKSGMNMGMGIPGINIESFLHQLLDPNQKTIRLPDLDIEIDISGLIIIAAGNQKLTSASIKNRMTEIVFPCIEAEKRPLIARKRFDALMAARTDLQSSKQDFDMINQIATVHPHCGVRSLELVVDDYVTWKDLENSNWGLSSEFNVTEAYKKHPSDPVD